MPVFLLQGNLEVQDAEVEASIWSEPEGFEVTINESGYQVVWKLPQAGTTPVEARSLMLAAVERRVTAFRFSTGRPCRLTSSQLLVDGAVDDLHLNVYTARTEYPKVPVDFGQYGDTAAALRNEAWMAEVLQAYTEAAPRTALYPRARLYWALEVLIARAGDRQKLTQRIGWSKRRFGDLTRALQHHRHPGYAPILSNDQCRMQVREVIVAYAKSLGYVLNT